MNKVLKLLLLAAWLPALPLQAAETQAEYIQKAEQAFERADIVNAITWYRKAAELGNAPAQTRLAYLLDNSEENESALDWYRKAADQGYAEAEYGLAQMYAAGEGTEKDELQALEWFQRAADQGHLPAIRLLSQTYEKGQLGQHVNYTRTLQWLNAGIDANDSWSMQRLARAHRNGELGLRIDIQKADQLEKQLAQKRQENAVSE